MALDDQDFDSRTELVSTARLLALSDGIFAIAATLLVLNLGPTGNLADSALHGKIAAYVLSFVIVGTFWIAHHRMFSIIQHADTRLLWLNIAFLFFVSALPFVTSVLTSNTEKDGAVGTSVYAGTLALMALIELALWLYACAGRRLVPADLAQRVVINRASAVAVAAAIFASSIPIAFFVNADLAKYWWLLLIPITAILRRVFSRLKNAHAPEGMPASSSASPSSSSPRSTTRA